MPIAEKLDEYGKGAWIALILLGFWVAWPIGLALLVFTVATGRMRGWKMQNRGSWYVAQRRGGGFGWGSGEPPSSGNAAFDEYRAETLRRLEEEQREFVEYLEKLRAAKDKAEFDAFMAERRSRQTPQAA